MGTLVAGVQTVVCRSSTARKVSSFIHVRIINTDSLSDVSDIFKLSQGEYIRPEYIENVYKQSPYIANVFVHGDSLQRFLVAIVVPDFEVLSSWAAENKLEKIANV